MAQVEAHAQRRTGGPELLWPETADNIADGKIETLNGQVAGLTERHERAALLHERLQRLHAFRAEAAAIRGRRHGSWGFPTATTTTAAAPSPPPRPPPAPPPVSPVIAVTESAGRMIAS